MSAPTMEKPRTVKAPIVKDQPLFIDGRFVDSSNQKTFATINPATGETICQVAEASAQDVDRGGEGGPQGARNRGRGRRWTPPTAAS